MTLTRPFSDHKCGEKMDGLFLFCISQTRKFLVWLCIIVCDKLNIMNFNSFLDKIFPTTPPEIINSEKSPTEKLLEFRFNQSSISRLAEYITGMRPDDPRMPDRLIEDQNILRAKYHLPPSESKFNSLSDYEHFLKEWARKNNTRIRDITEFERFFEENDANGAHDDKTGIYVRAKRQSDYSYKTYLDFLEHELVHSEQKGKNMPIELREYEAYIVAVSIGFLERSKNDSGLIKIIFGCVAGSTSCSYKLSSGKNNEEYQESAVKPVWDNPEYFLLNVDKVSQNEIDEYKKIIKPQATT